MGRSGDGKRNILWGWLKIVNNRDCVIQSWLSAYVVKDFIYFYANVQLMKRDIVTAVIYCYISTDFHYAKT